MSNIYQSIWDADQLDNGIKPVLSEADGDASQGYIVSIALLDQKQAVIHKVFYTREQASQQGATVLF